MRETNAVFDIRLLIKHTDHLPRQASDTDDMENSTKHTHAAAVFSPRRLYRRAQLLNTGAETRLFEPFLYVNAHFAKTGSGQT